MRLREADRYRGAQRLRQVVPDLPAQLLLVVTPRLQECLEGELDRLREQKKDREGVG